MKSLTNNELECTIDKIIDILEKVQEREWSAAFRNLQKEYRNAHSQHERKIVLSKIMQLYSGMGSFSDLVLYHKGRLLIEETNTLNQLRIRLFQLLMELR